MKLKIWGEKPKDEEPFWDGNVKVSEVSGRIYLEAVDKNGKFLQGGNLIRVELGKGVFHFTDVNEKLGFPLDKDGRIKED